MSNTPNYDAAVKQILSATQPGERTCAILGTKWNLTDEELSWCKKMNVPPSKLDPITRIKHMTCFWGAGFRLVSHPVTGKSIVTTAHPGANIKIIPDIEWHDNDFSSINLTVETEKSFFDQLYQLRLAVPHSASRNLIPAENSISVASKGDINSYFVVACKSKNCLYGVAMTDCEQVVEGYNSKNISDSKNIVFSQKIFNCQYVQQSAECLNSAFLFDCHNCENCFGAWNQRNKKFLWWNEQLTESDWWARREKVNLASRSEAEEQKVKFLNILQTETVWPENFNINAENCVGEYLVDCKDNKNCYYGNGGANNVFWDFFSYGLVENCAFCGSALKTSDSYSSITLNSSKDCLFSGVMVGCQNMEYCYECYNCENCFGCISLKNKKFCILNKQYTEEEYWPLVDRLKVAMLERGEYGNFFPVRFSINYYPESGASIYFGATAEELLKIGAPDLDPNAGEVTTETREIRDAATIPDSFAEVDLDDYSGASFLDTKLKRKFSLLKAEISLCKKLGFAPSVSHPSQRIADLAAFANIGIWKKTNCFRCQKEITVAENRVCPNRKIYCRGCYLKYLEENN